MRTKFPAYYRLHQTELLDKFSDCSFVFDASALLDIFRLKSDLTNRVFDVMNHYKDQIVVPYHVAEEYNRNILKVLTSQIKKIEESRRTFAAFKETFSAKRNYPYISKDTSEALAKLEEQLNKDLEEQEKYLKHQIVQGEYQNKMASLLDGQVLEPFEENEMKEIYKEGAERYSKKNPPGWKDASKDENRYGDLVNWKEILKHAKESGKSIIYVVNDQKPDWVLKEGGITIGPLYELLSEFYKEVGNNDQLFHIYTLDGFLDFVHKKDSQVVSEKIVEDVRESIASTIIPSIPNMKSLENIYQILGVAKKYQDIQTEMFSFANRFSEIQDRRNALSPISGYQPQIGKIKMVNFTDEKESDDKASLIVDDGTRETIDKATFERNDDKQGYVDEK